MLPGSELLCLEWDLGLTQIGLFHGRFQLSVNLTANREYFHSRQAWDQKTLVENFHFLKIFNILVRKADTFWRRRKKTLRRKTVSHR